MDNYKAEFFKELFDNAPDEIKDLMAKFACDQSDRMVSTNEARREYRAKVEANPEALAAFDVLCARYDLNIRVIQSLGNLKALLEDFDPNNYSTAKLMDNIKLHKFISTTWMLSVQNVSEQIDKVMELEDKVNEIRDGDSSG